MRLWGRRQIVLLFVLWIAGWSTAEARELVDMSGKSVVVPEVIHKAYSTSPPITYMIYALDRDLLAGLNNPPREWEGRFMPPSVKQLPVIGGWFGQGQTPNLETLVQTRPDVVLVWNMHNSVAGGKVEDILKPLGFPVVEITLNSINDTPAAFRLLGNLLHREGRAEALSRYAEKALEEIKAVRDTIAETEKITVYYAEGPDGLATECKDSFHAELIPLCGGVNVHDCLTKNLFGMDKISVEQVIHYSPQVILTHDPVFFDSVFRDPRWRNIPAVRDHRVYWIPIAPFNWFDRPPSFMRLLGAKWLLNRLYPQRFAIDVTAETIAFYRLFLNASLDEKAAAELRRP